MPEEKPGICLRNAYYMLCYILRSLPEQRQEQGVGQEDFEHVHELFAALLGAELARLLKQGLYREYCGHTDALPLLRGKVDMPGTIRQNMACRRLLVCEYDELSEDNLFNRIIKTTALLLIRHKEVSSARRAALKKLMPFLAGVGTLDAGRIPWAQLHYRRENRHYRLLMELCRFILEEWLLTTEAGDYKLASYMDEKRMEVLYERFLLNFFVRECPWVHAAAPHIRWKVQEGCDTAQLPCMKSDMVLTCGSRTLIIDAKWYTNNMQGGKLHSPHLYQISTYVNHYTATHPQQQVSGLLLYARTTAPTQPKADLILQGRPISAHALDMGAPFEAIAANLKAIAGQLGVQGAACHPHGTPPD